jgi:hypothetical protein
MDGDPMATRNHPGPNAAAGDPELAAVARQIIDANRYLARIPVNAESLAGNRR